MKGAFAAFIPQHLAPDPPRREQERKRQPLPSAGRQDGHPLPGHGKGASRPGTYAPYSGAFGI